jgi:DNA replication protein DnaC
MEIAMEGNRALSMLQQTKTGPVDQLCKIHSTKMYKIPTGEIICVECEEENTWKNKNAQIEQRKVNKKNKEAAWHLEHLDLPKRLQDYTFDNYKTDTPEKTKAVDTCKKFVASWPNVGGMVLVGRVGTGKTHLAVSVCKSLCVKGQSCRILTISKIIRAIKGTWSKTTTDDRGTSLTEQEAIDNYSKYGLLVIDEIGAQYGSDSERIFITEIINNRYEQELPTILIGNVTKTELESLVGNRAVDRVLHNGGLVVFNWESHRR